MHRLPLIHTSDCRPESPSSSQRPSPTPSDGDDTRPIFVRPYRFSPDGSPDRTVSSSTDGYKKGASEAEDHQLHRCSHKMQSRTVISAGMKLPEVQTLLSMPPEKEDKVVELVLPAVKGRPVVRISLWDAKCIFHTTRGAPEHLIRNYMRLLEDKCNGKLLVLDFEQTALIRDQESAADAAQKIWGDAYPKAGAYDHVLMLDKQVHPTLPTLHHYRLLYVDLEKGRISLLESLAGPERDEDGRLMDNAQDFILEVFKTDCSSMFIPMPEDKAQHDRHSCGIYVMIFGRETLAASNRLPMTREQVGAFRVQLAHEILCQQIISFQGWKSLAVYQQAKPPEDDPAGKSVPPKKKTGASRRSAVPPEKTAASSAHKNQRAPRCTLVSTTEPADASVSQSVSQQQSPRKPPVSSMSSSSRSSTSRLDAAIAQTGLFPQMPDNVSPRFPDNVIGRIPFVPPAATTTQASAATTSSAGTAAASAQSAPTNVTDSRPVLPVLLSTSGAPNVSPPSQLIVNNASPTHDHAETQTEELHPDTELGLRDRIAQLQQDVRAAQKEIARLKAAQKEDREKLMAANRKLVNEKRQLYNRINRVREAITAPDDDRINERTFLPNPTRPFATTSASDLGGDAPSAAAASSSSATASAAATASSSASSASVPVRRPSGSNVTSSRPKKAKSGRTSAAAAASGAQAGSGFEAQVDSSKHKYHSVCPFSHCRAKPGRWYQFKAKKSHAKQHEEDEIPEWFQQPYEDFEAIPAGTPVTLPLFTRMCERLQAKQSANRVHHMLYEAIIAPEDPE